ncbi:DUF885 domain-containing protein [Nocardia fusca]|uniref:DUF885 domain-containing protein n=1 Tax=Nocardia fusca TaxID=941183 RepID=UPI0037A9725F
MEAKLARLSDLYWDAVLAAAPTEATTLGDHRFDAQIEDFSVEAEQQRLATMTDLLSRVNALDPGGLNEPDRVTYSLLRGALATEVDRLGWRPLELASDQMDGVHATALTLTSQIQAPEPEHARALLQRYRQFGSVLAHAERRFRDGLAAGRLPARLVIERSLHQLDGYLASDLGTDPFATMAGPSSWDGESRWRAELAQVVVEVIRPAFAQYRDVLADELLPVSRPDDRAGLCWLGDDGTDIYQRLLREHTTLPNADADEIHELGLAEVARLRGEYAELGERVFGTSDVAAVFTRLRTDPSLRYRNGQQIIADARRYLAAAADRMGDWFGRLPAQTCDIVEVPEFLAADSPAAYYFPPPADGSRPGAYYVNGHDPQDRGRYETAAVAFHEAIPGHHFQLTIAGELTHLPRFQRQSFGNTAFVEGWGLYAERLADEMGLYDDDLARLGMLTGDSWRSCRLVVDTGLHAKGWSRRQAIDYMTENVPAGLSEIEVEVDRYIAIPGQAVAYKIGQLEIQRQRAVTAARLGARFDIAAFHDTVLGSGSVSLPVLREMVGAI